MAEARERREQGRSERVSPVSPPPQVKYYLLDDASKKSHLQTLLRLYARDRSVDSLASSLDVLLEGPIERRLLPYIRSGQLAGQQCGVLGQEHIHVGDGRSGQ